MPNGKQMDEKTYKSAKKYLKAAMEHVIEAGRGVREFSEFTLEKFGDDVLPHVRRFYEDIRHGKVKIKGLKKTPRELLFGLHVTPQEREEMVRLAAFVRAEKRGFIGGSPVDDWHAAEKEVAKKLEEDVGLVEKGRKAVASVSDTVEEEYDHVKKVVTRWMEGAGENTPKAKKPSSNKKEKIAKRASADDPGTVVKSNSSNPAVKTAAKKTAGKKAATKVNSKKTTAKKKSPAK